ncbi:MAG: hypothetical protein ACLPPF_02080 [Rhodomicrobium sp.]
MPQLSAELGVLSQREFRLGQAVSRAFDILTRHAVPFSLIGIVAWLPLGIVTYFSLGMPPQLRQLRISGTSLLVALLQLAAVAVIVYATFQDMRGRQASMGESIARGLRRIFPLIGTGILLMLGFFLGVLVFIVPGTALIQSYQQAGAIVTGLGAAVLVVLALILLARWYVFAPVCVVEKKGPLGCLKRSAALTKGNRWKIFAIFVLLTLIGAVANVALKLLLSAVAPVAGIVASGLWQGIWSAFNNVLSVVIYHDLRAGKEGVDIESIASVFD